MTAPRTTRRPQKTRLPVNQLGVGRVRIKAITPTTIPKNASYDKENRMATLAEDATLNIYTYDSDGFKKVENVGGSLSTLIWNGTDYLGEI